MPPAIVHVPEEALGLFHHSCPICASKAPRKPELLLQSTPDVWMRHCSVCEASVADRFPDESFLAQLYDPSHYSSPVSAEPTLSDRCARRLHAFFNPPPDSAIEILDYGGNQGGLVRALRQRLIESGHTGSIQGTVVDIYPRPNEPGLRFIAPEQFAAESVKYDLVLASAVLEHLARLRDVFEQLTAACRPGALLYARTPYDVPLARLPIPYRVRWPGHLYDLGPDFWHNILNTASLKGTLKISRPSLVETSWQQSPLHTAFAHLLKLPSRVEMHWAQFTSRPHRPLWRWVGGWEVLLALDSE